MQSSQTTEGSRATLCFSTRSRAKALRGDLVVISWLARRALTRIGDAIQNANRIGFELDGDLLDHVLNGLLAVRNRDGTVVLARGQFALDEDVGAFHEA
jgi:hypothetical protein